MPPPTKRVRGVGFDLDGTLIDTVPDLTAAVNGMLGMLGGRELSELQVRGLVGAGVEQLVARALAESLADRLHAQHESAALASFRRLYGQALFRRSTVYAGVESALRALTEEGVSLCCITNKVSEFALPLLEDAGLRRFFTFTLCADRQEQRKPSPYLLLSACSRLGLTPADMLYVGDAGTDIAAARAAGCRSVAVSYGYTARARLEHCAPDALIDSLMDLANGGRAPVAGGRAS